MEQEIYQALPSQHIRVVFVEPGNWDDELRCSLRTVPLEGKGAVYYEALSYCWGKNALTSTLITPCGKLLITKTCDEAIRRLRWRTHTRFVFSDRPTMPCLSNTKIAIECCGSIRYRSTNQTTTKKPTKFDL